MNNSNAYLNKGKGKWIYNAPFCSILHSRRSGMVTLFYPYLALPRKRSPDGATTDYSSTPICPYPLPTVPDNL